jgi:hypothetical protein
MSESLASPLVTAMLATGNIRNYQIIVGGLQMMNLPLSYLFLKWGYPAETVFIVAIFISICCEMARLYMLRGMIQLSMRSFLREVYFNVILVTIIAAVIPVILFNVLPEDFGSNHPLAGVDFQEKYERLAYELGGKNYNAPAQLVGDFLNDKVSTSLGKVEASYKPGITFVDLRECLPEFVTTTMKEALVSLNRKLDGFAMYDAVLTGVETRSSAPIRIVRDEDSLESVNTKNLYPCGEGAGYAGGIVTAAVDGIKCAEKIIQKYSNK